MQRRIIVMITLAGIIAVALLSISYYEMTSSKVILPQGARIILWYMLVLYVCYQSIWGYFVEDLKTPSQYIRIFGRTFNMPQQVHNKLLKSTAIILFLASTAGTITGISSLIAK